ncbi:MULTISPECIES: PLP-dependent aminotransferase family protein [unclassified Martelella]|uniref:aminotransferase-like domain-containing protein n=1 Tax=unclassified Martelella TaxID=2629616 RepID=UPI0025BFAE8B|nr:PLP-dependent aminotransferase family protein [Martelella sp.]
MWTPRLIEGARMKYLGIVEALEADIQSGRVVRGERLPAQRAIAEALDVDLTTVTRAFNEARRRGLVSAQAGRGTFISEIPYGAAENATPFIDLSMNIPPQPADAAFGHMIPDTLKEILNSPAGMLHLHYQESTGAEPDRIAAARWLGERIDGLGPDRLVVSAGAQCALFAICDLLLGRGDVVAAGAMTYPGLKAVAIQKALSIAPLAMDSDGILPDAFEKACRDRPVKLLYVIPSIDNPTTATLPEERRRALAEIARRHDVVIVEDDPYAALLPDPAPTLSVLAPDITWHIATLSKCATPALRVAYVATPSDHAARRLASVLRATMLMAPPLMSALASRWIATGALNATARSIRSENMARQKIAATNLASLDFSADPHGHHLWLRLPSHWRASDLAEHANRAGVSIVPALAFATVAHPLEAVRISLGVAPDRDVLEEGLSLLSGLIAQPLPGTRAIV